MSVDDVFVYTEGSIVPKDVTHVLIDSSVKVIHDRAFESCSQLTEVELGNDDGDGCCRLQTIGKYAFAHCHKLKRVGGASDSDGVIIGEGLRRIGKYAFSHCRSLKYVTLPSTIKAIPDGSFLECGGLVQVHCNEGESQTLERIGIYAFQHCVSLQTINIPHSVTRFGQGAFAMHHHGGEPNSLMHIHIPDAVEFIGTHVFQYTNLVNVKIPPLLTKVPNSMLLGCKHLCSLELPEGITLIRDLQGCCSLRNLAIPNTAERESFRCFRECFDLHQIFNTENDIWETLRHRFDGLPIHKLCYYQPYCQREQAIKELEDELLWNDGTVTTDCLGMSPLHILACSTKQDIRLYKLIIEKQPESLITEDKFGALPIHYVCRCNAPRSIFHFFIETHKSLFPDDDINWKGIIKTLSAINGQLDFIREIAKTQTDFFPNQTIDRQSIVRECTQIHWFQFKPLVMWSLEDEWSSIGIQKWIAEVETMLGSVVVVASRRRFINDLYGKIAEYQQRFREVKEGLVMIELALWKHNTCSSDSGNTSRNDYRFNCGAVVVIPNVLPFLIG